MNPLVAGCIGCLIGIIITLLTMFILGLCKSAALGDKGE